MGPLESPNCLFFEYGDSARLLHTGSERWDRHGLEGGQEKDKYLFFQNRFARSPGGGGVNWRHRREFPICLDQWKARSVYFLNMHGCARLSHTGLERSDSHGSEVVRKSHYHVFLGVLHPG